MGCEFFQRDDFEFAVVDPYLLVSTMYREREGTLLSAVSGLSQSGRCNADSINKNSPSPS